MVKKAVAVGGEDAAPAAFAEGHQRSLRLSVSLTYGLNA